MYFKKSLIFKILYWTVICAVVVPVLFVATIIIVYYYQFHYGLNGKAILVKYSEAMSKGKCSDAIFWAKKGYAYEILGRGGQIRNAEQYISQAYELNGQISLAVSWYEIYLTTHHYEWENDIGYARLCYKNDDTQKAFEIYCRYGHEESKRFQEELQRSQSGRISALRTIRTLIMRADNYRSQLLPFIEYKDFLTFMEKEYENLGCPPEYGEVMKLFHDIGSETVD